jgi:outer membrane protein assembly factor BamD (BamD/ComL family)
MPMARIFFLIITFFVSFLAWGAGIYVRNSGHFSEFVLSGFADRVVSVSEGESRIMLELTTPLKAGSAGRFKDPFIRSVSVDGHMLIINFFPNTDYTYSARNGDILITAAKKKTDEDIQLGYSVEQPLLKGTEKILEDKNAEEIISMIDKAMNEEDYQYALSLAENFLSTGIGGYYRQEAQFRQGMIYFKLGEQADNNYIYAGKIFDDFVNEFPDSYRKKDALIKSAEAKEMAMLFSEAVFAYNNVIKSLRDRDIKKMAYERIAEIYSKSGQYINAIEAHEEVIRNFRETFTTQKAKIGVIQARNKDFDLAYRTFLTVLDNRGELGKLTPEELYIMADVLAGKSQYPVAREIYEKVYAIYPSSEFADLSMYNSARMLEKEGNAPATDGRLDICRQVYKDKKGGLMCSVMYARRHVKEKTPDEWEQALKSALESKDIDIRSEAELVLIRAFFEQENYDKAGSLADNFIRKNFTSSYLPEVYRVKQEITLTKAREAFRKSRYAEAKGLIEGMLQIFPDSEFKRQAQEILQDISFGDIRDKYQAGRYKETVDDLTRYLTENTELINPDKWMNMLQEAKFAYAKELYTSGDLENTIVAASEYLSSFPNGVHKTEAEKMLTDAISGTADRFYKNKEFIRLISLYEHNSTTVQNGGTTDFRDKLKSYTAFSLYKMGMNDQSGKMLDSVENRQNPYYLMTSIMLNRLQGGVDPNLFKNDMMDFLVQELEGGRVDYLVSMLNRYTNDKAYSAKQVYSVSKGIFDDQKRENVLFGLYDRLDKDEASRFEGYSEVYLDAGIAYYKKNNFDNSVKVLEQFKLKHMPRDEKRAEGLYYLGKSYLKMKKNEEGVNSLMELLESVPNSVYASAARSELEELNWRKNLKK